MDPINPTQFQPHELLTAAQIGQWLGCSPKSARNWLHRRAIKPVDAPGRTHRYRADGVQRALEHSHPGSEAA